MLREERAVEYLPLKGLRNSKIVHETYVYLKLIVYIWRGNSEPSEMYVLWAQSGIAQPKKQCQYFQHNPSKFYRLKDCLLSEVPVSITVTNKTWSEEGIAVSLTRNWFYCNSAIPSVRAKSEVYKSTYVAWALWFSFDGPLCWKKQLCCSCPSNPHGFFIK